MDAICYTQACRTLTEIMDGVCEDQAPIIITRHNRPPVVTMSLDDYHSIEATLHLFKSPKNAMHLMTSLAQYGSGVVLNKTLEE